jgi:hypothetical protein
MADVYYWVLCHVGLRPFSKTRYYALRPADVELPTNPALALRWVELEGAEQFAARLQGSWTPRLVRFDGAALCGGVSPSPNSTQ